MFETSSSPVLRGDGHAPGDVRAGVRDEELGAVHHPRAVAQLRRRTRRAGVRACVGLGEAERGEPLACREIRQPALLLLVGPVEQDRHRPERRVGRQRDRDRGVHTRQLLDDDRVRDGVRSGSAVLLGNGEPHQPELRELGHELVRKATAHVELGRDRLHALACERAHGVANQLLLGGEVEVHAARIVAAR